MKKGFGDLLSKSWSEYKKNFKLIFKIFLILIAIPSIILFLHSQTIVIPETIETVEQFMNIGATKLVTSGVLGIIVLVLSLLMTITLISAFFSKKIPDKALTAIKKGANFLLKGIGLTIVMTIALIPLFILLIIPGIIFAVFWTFAYYVMIGENKGIIDSLKGSYNLVKGRWWKVLGYGLLMFLVMLGITIIISIPGGIITGILSTLIGKGTISGLTSEIINLGIEMIITPLGILFAKNFYLSLKS